MTQPPDATVKLVLGWKELSEDAKLRRNEAGFDRVKQLALEASADQPLKLNAFLYAFLCPAKNFDLFLTESMEEISEDVAAIDVKMNKLAEFEREAKKPPEPSLREPYLAVRAVVSRRTARDERRTLATLLFSGPSSSHQIAEDLGIPSDLAERILRALAPVVEHDDKDGAHVLHTDTDSLAATLHLLRSTLGVDPLAVLQRRMGTRRSEGI